MHKLDKNILLRIAIAVFSVLMLVLIFLFQKFRYDLMITSLTGHDFSNSAGFIINKVIRFLLNDFLAIAFIYALFFERKYVVFAIWVQIFGFCFFLIPYLIFSLHAGIRQSVMISYLHRIVMNPTLLLLLIPAFLYQRKLNS